MSKMLPVLEIRSSPFPYVMAWTAFAIRTSMVVECWSDAATYFANASGSQGAVAKLSWQWLHLPLWVLGSANPNKPPSVKSSALQAVCITSWKNCFAIQVYVGMLKLALMYQLGSSRSVRHSSKVSPVVRWQGSSYDVVFLDRKTSQVSRNRNCQIARQLSSELLMDQHILIDW